MRESKTISIDEIRPNPYQPRIDFDDEALMELSQSIRENGLIHPITVRKEKDGYEIVAGERRYRAMKIAGMIEIPVVVIDADEVQMAEMALVENIQRENLSAIEEAKAYVQIMKTSGINQSQLALKVGKSQSSIANKIRLLQLDEEVQKAVTSRKISERHARALLALPKEKQEAAMETIVKKGMTVAQSEKMIQKEKEEKTVKHKKVLKGLTRNIKIGLNTIEQAVSMIEKSGIEIHHEVIEKEEEVIVTLHFPK
ncbi:ParB/RepB/Spo0J family partition protein [Merdibacter massiliensis]|uniref:ParB/RepB/Spo0J family partition protein n=1 Tax=Merdibacter massiliensis TaxID=1871030 RepID=UPI00096A4284|nr:ParB/RepB/Spo0J family partition protein [Merdibacter massiliensis]